MQAIIYLFRNTSNQNCTIDQQDEKEGGVGVSLEIEQPHFDGVENELKHYEDRENKWQTEQFELPITIPFVFGNRSCVFQNSICMEMDFEQIHNTNIPMLFDNIEQVDFDTQSNIKIFIQ